MHTSISVFFFALPLVAATGCADGGTCGVTPHCDGTVRWTCSTKIDRLPFDSGGETSFDCAEVGLVCVEGNGEAGCASASKTPCGTDPAERCSPSGDTEECNTAVGYWAVVSRCEPGVSSCQDGISEVPTARCLAEPRVACAADDTSSRCDGNVLVFCDRTALYMSAMTCDAGCAVNENGAYCNSTP